MAASEFSEFPVKKTRAGRAMSPPKPKRGKMDGTFDMPMRTGFTDALPGPTQKRDRSGGGVRKAKIYANSKGL